MGKVDFESAWNDVGNEKKGGGNGGRAEFMRLGAGKYTVRLLGTPVRFFKFMHQGSDGRWRSAVVMDPDDNVIVKKHNLKPTERYAINVIDRADGKIKILEAGISVFSEFKKVYEIVKRNIGGAEGSDFTIIVEGAGRGKKYTTKFANNTPITDEEAKYVKEHGLYSLEDIFKPTPNDELEAKLFGDATSSPDSGSSNDGDSSWGSDDGDDLASEPSGSGTEVDTNDLPF